MSIEKLNHIIEQINKKYREEEGLLRKYRIELHDFCQNIDIAEMKLNDIVEYKTGIEKEIDVSKAIERFIFRTYRAIGYAEYFLSSENLKRSLIRNQKYKGNRRVRALNEEQRQMILSKLNKNIEEVEGEKCSSFSLRINLPHLTLTSLKWGFHLCTLTHRIPI